MWAKCNQCIRVVRIIITQKWGAVHPSDSYLIGTNRWDETNIIKNVVSPLI